MKNKFNYAIALSALLVLADVGHAAITLSLNQTDPTDDLSALVPGQIVEFEVELSGLLAGESLDFLSAQVSYDSSIFDPPPTVTAGAIVPDLSGFASAIFPTDFTADYDVLFAASGTPISTNGVFLSFDLSVRVGGQGDVGVDLLDAVPTPNAAVPEPSSCLLFVTGLGLLGLARRRHKRVSKEYEPGSVRSS